MVDLMSFLCALNYSSLKLAVIYAFDAPVERRLKEIRQCLSTMPIHPLADLSDRFSTVLRVGTSLSSRNINFDHIEYLLRVCRVSGAVQLVSLTDDDLGVTFKDGKRI